MTHGHFLQMGGFMLMDGNVNKGVLTAQRFQELLGQKKINLPTITEEEIQDRSKGDGLSKTIAIAQTTWFIVQFFLRKKYGLLTTELELITLALAFFNGAIYLLWWPKPLDVRCPIPVALLPEASIPVQDAELTSGESLICGMPMSMSIMNFSDS